MIATETTIETFLAGLIDYAGLFPPAQLPMDEAIHNYAAYRQTTDEWMLGRFICPASRLHELTSFETLFSKNPPFRFSVLGRGGIDAASFLNTLQKDLDTINQFEAYHRGCVRGDLYEVRMPASILETTPMHQIGSLIGETAQQAEKAGVRFETMYFEDTLGRQDTVDRLAKAIAYHNAQRTAAIPEAGFKIRCGGVTANLFPSTTHIAHVIASCRDAGIPLKATAGLHHPIRHFNDSLQTHMHGFLNVFGAAVLAYHLPFQTSQIQAILEEQEIGNFTFGEAGFTWKAFHVSSEQVQVARRHLARSYGSCSFDEPREDLQEAGLL